MSYASAPYDAHTIGLMSAALEAAWMAANLGVAGLTHQDRAKMERAILIAVALGELEFKALQEAAFDAMGATQVKPIDRRQNPPLRLVGTDRRRG